jgi:hypothetical protein
LNDPDVAAIRYTWRPTGIADTLRKPIGGFHVGQSPACLQAIGVAAQRCGCPSSHGIRAALRAELYGSWVDWVVWRDDAGALVTLFPLADGLKARPVGR